MKRHILQILQKVHPNDINIIYIANNERNEARVSTLNFIKIKKENIFFNAILTKIIFYTIIKS